MAIIGISGRINSGNPNCNKNVFETTSYTDLISTND